MQGVYKKHKNKSSIGIGYVIIPPDKPREEYIEKALRNNRVSILLEEGMGVAHDCYISKECIQNIDFPSGFGITGTPVMYYSDSMRGLPIIFSTYTKEDESELLEQKERKISYVDPNSESYAEIGVKGKTGEAYINVYSELESGGILNINIKNKDRSGKLKVNVMGDVEEYASNSRTIESKEVNIKSKNVTNSTELDFNMTDKASLKNGDEDLLQLIDDLIAQIKLITVPTAVGTSGTPVNATAFSTLLTRFKKLLKNGS